MGLQQNKATNGTLWEWDKKGAAIPIQIRPKKAQNR